MRQRICGRGIVVMPVRVCVTTPIDVVTEALVVSEVWDSVVVDSVLG